MSTYRRCDGCGVELAEIPRRPRQEERVISGRRVNDLQGGGLPDGEFDWCLRCSQIAFAAVRNARKT